MPLHGWLLEPWRNEARRHDKNPGGCADGKNLTELWADVFERAVLGWSQATVEGKGIVEKALAYEEQASGWVDMHNRWHELVNAAVCGAHRCSSKGCRAGHPVVFIIAIDDVDLQVEQVPHLLHAIRLLHHPNVAYVLTGHMEHLRFVLELDYIRRHESNHRHVEHSAVRDLSDRIRSYSCLLRDALLEKALPSHATLSLPLLSLDSVLSMPTGSDGIILTVKGALGKPWDDFAIPMKDLGIVTARHAQHAIDKHLHTPRMEDEAVAIKFIADVCGTTVDDRGRVRLRGRLTTHLGPVFQTWEGDRLSIQLRDQPRFALQRQFNEAEFQIDEEANRAAIIQFAVEENLVDAPGLVWSPDAGVVTTDVRWKSNVDTVDGNALFHWPWLVRPTVTDVLKLGEVAEQMKRGAGEGIDRDNLSQEMIVVWLRQNIEWMCQQEGLSDDYYASLRTLNEIAASLKRLCQKGNSFGLEARRWVRELVVMTAPYFGLPDEAASSLRKALESQGLVPDCKKIKEEEHDMVMNAIVVWRLDTARNLGRSFEGKDGPSSPKFDEAVTDFLNKRQEMSKDNDWWAWRDSPDGKGELDRTDATK